MAFKLNNAPFKKLDKSKMACNKPRKSPKPDKKKVVKACENGQEKIIHFGATGYGHNYSAAARKSFRARHKCDQRKSKLTASYWACKNLWAGSGGSKKSSPKGVRGKY
jgi:activator of 2-hydroxyglutaryl-CoA dehydratase